MKKITSLLISAFSIYLALPEIANAMEEKRHSPISKQALELQLFTASPYSSTRETPKERLNMLASEIARTIRPKERIALLKETQDSPEVLERWRNYARNLSGIDLLESIHKTKNTLAYYTKSVSNNGHTLLQGATTSELRSAADHFLFQVFGENLAPIKTSNFYRDKYKNTLNSCVFKAIEEQSVKFLQHNNHNDFKDYKNFIFNSLRIIPLRMVNDVMTYFLQIVSLSAENINQAHRRTKIIFRELANHKPGIEVSSHRKELEKNSSQYWQQMLNMFMKFDDVPENERISKAIPFLIKSKIYSKGQSVKFLQGQLKQLKKAS